MRWLLAWIPLAACGGDVSEPTARLELVGSLADTPPLASTVFDDTNHLLVVHGDGLRRLVDLRLDKIAGTETFALSRIGLDREGRPLLGSQHATIARLLPGDIIEQVAIPPPPSPFITPHETPAGAIFVIDSVEATFLLAPGAPDWIASPRALTRTLQAPDHTRYAIIDGDVVRFAADDSLVAVADCTPFGGGTCGTLELGGFDAAGQLYMGGAGAPAIQVVEPGGAIRELDLPGNLVVFGVAAGAQMVVVIANDPERANEQSLWLVGPDDSFTRVMTLTVTNFIPIQLLVDRAGVVHLILDAALQQVVLQ